MALPNADTLLTYGGQKQNRQQPANAQFDYDALQLTQAFSDVAGMTNTAFRAILVIQLGNDTGEIAPTLVSWNATWQTATPTVPILANVSRGVFTITFPTSVSDENSVITPLNFIGGFGGATSLTTFFSINVAASVNVITVAVGTQAGGASDNFAGDTIVVGVR